MELVWSTEDLKIAGRPHPGFPILLWDTMESCAPVNQFIRHYLVRGKIGSKKSWPSTGRAMYDFFSFLQAHELDWQDVNRGEAKTLLAGYRDYCLNECQLKPSTTRQRLSYVCSFYEYALLQGWVRRLPFEYESRAVKSMKGLLTHVDASGGMHATKNIMPRSHRTHPKFLRMDEIRALMSVVKNPHHRMMIHFALQTGLRRAEIATFPMAYIIDPDKLTRNTRNIEIHLDPYDGYGICTKGKKPRTIYISRKFLSILYRYVVQIRGERASLTDNKHRQLFLNHFGQPYADNGKRIERIVRELGKRADIKVYPHMLRHTYATHTLSRLQKSSGKIDPLVFLMRQLGHSSIDTTMIYAHLVNELADDAVLAYDDELHEYWEAA
ncbi:integrase [Pseudomonas sp. JAI115]|uniref:tyrosine-type recombinase/integrase n=1 Tax=Pseudomonas sp. JAI115 TaxID=2723061 RepID=UPI001612F070|nr:site-specific integrase [Pseudomonas sp. JAI115]MBB6157644.1 integrase [Pseudomonas sp. JAI115]